MTAPAVAAPTATAPGSSVGRAAAMLDEYLGAPEVPDSRVSDRQTLAWDAASVLPAGTIAALNDWGVHSHYIPAQWGGRLTGILDAVLLLRTVARRDLTAAVGHGKTLLGAVCAWAAADASADRMARIVGAGDPVSWGLTEQGRGSDIGTSMTTADLSGERIVVDGHKWPIGNATRGRAITVLARTDERPGPRSLSLVLVDKTEADAATISYRARRPLHGIRGADISGIEFSGTSLGPDSLVGEPGRGLELVLKSLQLTRTMCAALSLGAGDRALSMLADLSEGDPGLDGFVAASAADILLAEAVTMTGTAVFHALPDEMALVSAFVKVLVPDLVDGVFTDAGAALGPAAHLADGDLAMFEKGARDSRVVGIFDGNSVVNLNVVINEFGNIARGDDQPADAVLAALRTEPEAFDMAQLRLVTRRGASVLRALPDLVARLDDGRTHPDAVRSAARLAAHWRELRQAVAAVERAPLPRRRSSRSPRN
ncbi:acyl-CoA dehydrogenase [Microbacterium sp. ET2]|uniref:acyl-CoA dehydrogenase n=1 Tax=Microbacterium albipurpureum TaxID=3050384 RepID=UPI00259C99E9|nr:acyl-CoA dehydrogenase [Microbacterium sp. ET2 (Ac-2212)]WJL94765.1 acyl-CoA dehydrogenase [Microbacterium sp. ET2 (Ac-2212)]